MCACGQIRNAEHSDHSGSIQVEISICKVALSAIQQIDQVYTNNVTVCSSSLQLTIPNYTRH